uniref:NADH-ubiquinone oxidoreductase chain 6 n=2 Tax=Ochthebius TaxID=174908 RepID=A0A7H0DKI1_9COLE|nr:NADH dehydrogenase subunit 6 [Ochthebius magnannulatus]YP_009995438.1 NADH dehydrogenase subunit 6 [Ochthebius mediterraneus]QNP09841.1 NADH dehydrogenase subunit 6 [Ochthebius magnannulatus]QNP09867.1 NADH dehydrogenase subunit 6 [Ochthebius mediterraneus]
MMTFLLIINITLSMNFMFMIHPLSMGMTLLIQTIVISLITGMLNFNYWFSYILFIVMIGGMLVLFIYMTSIASNEKFKFNNKLMILWIMMMMMIFIMFLYSDMMLMMINCFNYIINNNSNYFMMSKFLNKPSNIIMFMIIIYLFITLIAVVKITDLKSGPLRQKF